MDYQKLKKMLLKEDTLTKEQAKEILAVWFNKPRTYQNLLKRPDTSKPLSAYWGIKGEKAENEEVYHIFVEKDNLRVLSPTIALKFFALQDDEINNDFICLMNNLSFPREEDFAICAWPYLDERFVALMDSELTMYLIKDMHYIFDFKNDVNGDWFDTLFRSFFAEEEQKLLAINSMNIHGWKNKCTKYPYMKMAEYIIHANHFFYCGTDGPGEEAWFRKLDIRYRSEISSALNFFYKNLYQKQMKNYS